MQAVNGSLATRNAELDAFAHTVAHDLKNALNTIMGYAEMLDSDLEELPTDIIHVSTRAISRMSHKMNNIIEELMLLAGVRNQAVIAQPLDMAAIVAEAFQRIDYLIRDSHAEVNVPSNWPIALGHGPWVEEVWVNYVSNAIKYGGASGQTPRVELGATPLAAGFVRFWVRDNGRGLSPADQARLFTQFERLDQARASGHGLGLSIVKRIVEKLGGQVAVSSTIGAGSEFSFTLPTQD
jgi:signal transduction histidine kinase